MPHWSLGGEGLLWGHGSSLGPGSGKGLLSEFGPSGSHRTLIGSTIDRRNGHSHTFAQGLRSSPELCRPGWFSLHAHHVRQSFQANGKQVFVVPLSRYRQALLIERTCCCQVPLARFHLRYHGEWLSNTPLTS